MNRIPIAHRLPDRSGKPTAKASVQSLCGEDLQRIAGTAADECSSADSPQKLKAKGLTQKANTNAEYKKL